MIAILLLEDSVLDADLIRASLDRAQLAFSIERVTSRDAFAAAVATGGHDLILADYCLPSFDGMTALEIARAAVPETPFIFVSGTLGEEIAIESLKHGATDYVVKQRLQRLPAAVTRALAEATERRERRKAEEQEKLLIAELSHRVKNTLATVSSIANQTLRRSESLAAFETTFMGRLRALADAHTLLLRARWQSVELPRIVQQALKPFLSADSDAVRLTGPGVALDARMALPLSMVVHELATNAARHGALRGPGGTITVDWRIDTATDLPRLQLSWIERNVLPFEPPRHDGFGTMLIRHGIGHELRGTARLGYSESGLSCEIELPLTTSRPDVLAMTAA